MSRSKRNGNHRGSVVDGVRKRRRPRQMRGERQRRKLLAVAVRDGWVCWLCGRAVPTEPDGTGRDPRRASLDHITPLADGGSNGLENLRLAHAECNEYREWLEAA